MTDLNALAERLGPNLTEFLVAVSDLDGWPDHKPAPPIFTVGELRQAAQALRGMGWQDMESAPQGQRILADVRYDPPHRYFGSARVEIGTLDGIGWAGEGIMGEPVAWMPLPAARSALKERDGLE